MFSPIKIEEWVKKYPSLQNIFTKLQKYLRFNKEIFVAPWESFFKAEGTVLGITYITDKCIVSFLYTPPDEETFIHEMVHCAGGGEYEAYSLTELLLIAINEDWEPFDAMELMKVPLDKIENTIKSLFKMKSIDEFFEFHGTRPLYKVLPPPDEETKRKQVLAEILDGIEIPSYYLVIREIIKNM